ncbi:MAG: hypothetical protein ABS951_01620 [Solibacillus sp.]
MSNKLVWFLFSKIILPIIIVLISFILPYIFYNIALIFITALQVDVSVITENLDKLTDERDISKAVIGLVLAYLVLIIIRNNNKERVFNNGNIYYDMSYVYYWIAAKLLGYSKVTLMNVPIYLHYIICFKGDFQDIEYVKADEIDKPVQVKIINDNRLGNTINILIKDTYDIEEWMLPREILNAPMIIIDNYINTQNQRLFNKNIEKELKKQIDQYSIIYTDVNIFATTNTETSKSLINYCFKTAGRTGFKKVYVYKQERDYKFIEKKKVY